MTWLMALAARSGATGRMQRIAAGLIAFALLIALLGLLWGAWQAFDWLNDRQAAGRALDKRTADTLTKVVRADRAAGAAKAARDAANANETQAEMERIDNASDQGCDALDGLFGLCP